MSRTSPTHDHAREPLLSEHAEDSAHDFRYEQLTNQDQLDHATSISKGNRHSDDISESEEHIALQTPGSGSGDLTPLEYSDKDENAGTSDPGRKDFLRLPWLGQQSRPKKSLLSSRWARIGLVVGSIVVILALVGGTGYKVASKTIDGQSPPWYPSPKGGILKEWEESYRKAAAIVSKMSLIEKVNITTGTGWEMGMCVGNTAPATNVGFPALCLQDGPLGLRFADNITATPAGITVGATWNKDLMYRRGKLLGVEARLKGINVLLGPSVGPLGRMPAGGRNWEGFGSDPVLQGVAAAATIRGIQSEGVMATIKHLVGNEQEHFRQSWEWGRPNAISSTIDDRTLHELYGWPFMDSVREGVASVMCSYNQLNNSYACQNSKLLNGFLKDELGFQGFVQSDWLAQRSGVASALAGLDMSMPGDGLIWANGNSLWGKHLTLSVLNGSLPAERLDDMVTRIVAAWYQLGQDDDEKWPLPPPEGEGGPNFSSWTNDKIGLLRPGSDDTTKGIVNQYVIASEGGNFSHQGLSRRIAAEAITLLKNVDEFLPLSRDGWPQNVPYEQQQDHGKFHVAIIGQDAMTAEGGAVEFPYLVAPVDALRDEFHKDSVVFSSSSSNHEPLDLDITKQDLCIVFVNADAGEGYRSDKKINGDRNDLFLQNGGDDLVNHVADICGHNNPRFEATVDEHESENHVGPAGDVVVVVHSVGPVILESFIDRPNIKAVLYAHLPGQESGNALADVLFGYLNPSGHLPYTIGKSLDDYGPGAKVMYTSRTKLVPQQTFSEGLLIDYRHFDNERKDPRFEFGFGMSYTTFDLDEHSVSITAIGDGGERPQPLPAARPADDFEPPSYNSEIPNPAEAVFPSTWRKLKKYVYPYIKSVDEVKEGSYPYPKHSQESPSQAGGGQGGNPSLWETLVEIEVDVLNLGQRDGQAVVQCYIVFPTNVYEDAALTSSLGHADSISPNDESDANAGGAPSNRSGPAKLSRSRHANRRQEDGESETWDEPPAADLDSEPPPQDTDESSDPASSFEADSSDAASPPDPWPSHPSSPSPQTSARGTYIAFPPRVLRAFEKVHVARSAVVPGAHGRPHETATTGGSRRVKFQLTRRDLSYWSVTQQNWVLPDGTFGVEVGFSSRDVRIRRTIF